jgi:multiple sugar transport system substrate-binding protein
MVSIINRRVFLRISAGAGVAVLAAACQPKVVEKIVKETVEVEKQVEKVVKETVQVEKVVKETVVIEKVVEKAAPKERVVIRSTGWDAQTVNDVKVQMGEFYGEQHPEVEIEWIFPADYKTKIITMIAGGDAPDVIQTNSGMHEDFADRGALRILDELVARDKLDLTIYLDLAITGTKYKGLMYGLPRDQSNVPLYYNMDMFDEAGVAYPNKENWDWNDFLAACEKLTKDTNGDGQIDQWGIGISLATWNLTAPIWANGGNFLNLEQQTCEFERPETIEALEHWCGLQTVQEYSPPPGALPEIGWFGNMFTTQKVAMALLGPWFRPSLVALEEEQQFRWNVAFPPRSPNTGKFASAIYSDNYTMYSGCPNVEEAWGWLKWLCGRDGRKFKLDVLGARSIPPIKELTQTSTFLDYGGCDGQIILDMLPSCAPPPITFKTGAACEQVWTAELGLVLAEDKTVPEACRDICQQMTPLLKL